MQARLPSWPALAALLLGTAALAQDAPHAFVGARIEPVDAESIARGTLVVQGGRIVAVGAADTVVVPAGAVVVDVTGKTLIPGLVCSHSHIGAVAGADGSGPIQPEVRALDSIDPRDPGIQKA